MLLKYINSNRLSVIILFLLLPVLYWIPSWVQGIPDHTVEINGMPFGRWIATFNENFSGWASLIALLLVMLNGYLLIQLNAVHIFIPHRTQLPLLFYFILSLSITQLHYLTPALVASTLLILLFYRIFSAYKVETISMNFLDAGLLLSLASLFYFPAIFFFPGLLAGLILMRPFIWREWVFALIGLLIPYYVVFSGYYLLDIPINDIFSGMAESFTRTPKELRLSQIVNWSFILLFTLISSYYMARAIETMKIQSRVFFMLFLVFFVVSVIIFFTVSGSGTGMVYFAAIPLAYLFGYYFITCRRYWVNDLLFAIFLLLFIWQRIS